MFYGFIPMKHHKSHRKIPFFFPWLSQGIPFLPRKNPGIFAGAGDGSHAEARLGRSEMGYGILRLYQWEFQGDRYLNHMNII